MELRSLYAEKMRLEMELESLSPHDSCYTLLMDLGAIEDEIADLETDLRHSHVA